MLVTRSSSRITLAGSGGSSADGDGGAVPEQPKTSVEAEMEGFGCELPHGHDSFLDRAHDLAAALEQDADRLSMGAPTRAALAVRFARVSTREQRQRVLQAVEYNVFSFPAELVLVDLLSDSGTTAMCAEQWGALFWGDESYGRNRGYYYFLDALRDTFERGDAPHKRLAFAIGPEPPLDTVIDELFLKEHSGGFVNGGLAQLVRPNCFIVPQGRCAEYLLFSSIAEVRRERGLEGGVVLSNGWFDTTAAHAFEAGFQPLNCRLATPPVAAEDVGRVNHFAGDMDTVALAAHLAELGAERVPLVVLTVTNNTAAGQPVSLANIRETKRVTQEAGVPLFLDACRFAENAYFIQQYEKSQRGRSIPEIVRDMFSYADGFTLSLKKDGLANIGGVLCFRDCGLFHSSYTTAHADIGIRMKERQILCYGNDSYGGMTGRDIMAAAMGLYSVVKHDYLRQRVSDVQYLALELHKRGVPVVLPPGGHAVYIDMDRFFHGRKPWQEYGGVALCVELLRHFAIRGCELGPFAFEWDEKSEEERSGMANLVRLAVPRNVYSRHHMEYVAKSCAFLYEHSQLLPAVTVSRGKTLRLRHFQSGLAVNYEHDQAQQGSTAST